MYCVNCGVKLADSENQCPLCGTAVYHPAISQPKGELLYPQERYPNLQVSTAGALGIITALFLLPMLICLQCDVLLSGGISWSGYVSGALMALYVILVLPGWFRKPNPVIFVPCGFAAVGAYLLYINLATGGSWFLSFAFPVTGAIGLIVTAVVTLLRYVRRGMLYIIGGAFIALGAFMPLMEFLLVVTFPTIAFHWWSLYPLTALALLGGTLIFLAICRPARQTMERKLFI